ncbi:hypothetical protein WA588_006425, partial [Blastocystis sp. NMH]
MKRSHLLIVLLCTMALGMALPSLREELPYVSDILDEQNLWDFLEKIYSQYKIIVNGVIILIGLFICFLGLKSVVFNMFLCGFLAGGIPTFAIAIQLLANMQKEHQAFWISVGVSCGMGLIVGILLIFLYKIGYFIIGAAFGAIIAIYTDIILECFLRFHSNVLLYVAVGTIGLEFGIFSLIWDKIIVILSTSVIGSYLITFGLSQFIGNWINPFSHLFSQQLINPPWEWILYMSVLLAFSVFGVVVQGVTNRDIKQAPEENTTLPLIESQKTEVKKPKVSRERQFEPLSKLNKDH